MYAQDSATREGVDVATRLLSSNYVKNTSTGLQMRRQLCDGLSFNTSTRSIILFQNILRCGYIKDLIVMARPYIATVAAPTTPVADHNALCGTLKSCINKCDIWANSELLFSESNLEPYFSMCEQLKNERYEDEDLEFCQYAPTAIAGTANQSIDSDSNKADIIYERTLQKQRLGCGTNTGVATKSSSNSPQEKFVLFQLSDVLSMKGNYIPSMLLDQFSIQLGLTSAQNIIVSDDLAAVPGAGNPMAQQIIVFE